MMKDYMPRRRPIHVTRWPNNGTQQPAKHNVHLTQILFVYFCVGSTETSNRIDHGVEIPEAVSHCNIPVYQVWPVCKENFRRHLWRPPRSVRNKALSETALRLWNRQPPAFVGRLEPGSPATPYWQTSTLTTSTDKTIAALKWSQTAFQFGECPASSWHHHSFAAHQRWPTTAQGRPIRRNRLDRSPTQKRAYIPRTHAQPTMSTRRPWHRNRRGMERRNRQFCQAPHTRESLTNPTKTPSAPALGGICPYQPMDGPVDPCCLASRCRHPPRPGLHPSDQCWREWSSLERTPGPRLRPTPRAQPPPSQLLSSSGLDLARSLAMPEPPG